LDERLVTLAILFWSWGKKPMTDGDAAQVFVCDGYGVPERVEQNCIGRLSADTRQREETIPQNGSRRFT
jgi:hypothetical protein